MHTEEHIKKIIQDEFNKLIENMESDFKKNYKKKINNFLLNQLGEELVANMVFVSSFESKSGNAIEEVAQRVARLKYGNENVPSIVNPLGLKHDLDEKSIKGQVIVSNLDFGDSNLRGDIAQFRAENQASGKGKKRIESLVNQDNIERKLHPLYSKYKTDQIYSKPVDLAFKDEKGKWHILELKSGGDLDSSNAPSNIEKLLTIYVGMGIEQTNVYFGTLYNKNGEGNTWTGAVKKHLNYPSMFAIGKDFWNMILPADVTFDRFVQLYREALTQINLDQRISDLLRTI